MPPLYDFVCRKCGAQAELDRLPEHVTRHMVDGKVCGTFRRQYSTVNFNKVPGGGRG